MAAQNSKLRYGIVAMTLHWLIAAAVLINLAMGMYMSDLSRTDTSRIALFQMHKSIGLTILIVSILRAIWRLINPIPRIPRGMPAILRFSGYMSHFLFYFLTITIPLVGWAMVSSSATSLPTSYFGLFAWQNIPYFADMPIAAKHANIVMLSNTHAILAYSALGLFVLHVIAALYHQFVRRDDVLRRMLPGTDVSDPA